MSKTNFSKKNWFSKIEYIISAGETLPNNSLDDVIKEINNKIKKFDQKIIIEKYEPTKKEFCLFIKTADTITNK